MEDQPQIQQPLSLEQKVSTLENRVDQIENSLNSGPAGQTEPSSTGGGFGGDFIPAEGVSKLYTGPVLGGKKTRRHKNKRHSYSRKSKKGLKNRLKRLFGFKGGNSMKSSSGGGGTTVKSQH